ncbi:acyl-CoA thioesterase [Nocardioides mangrovicus]|uniref:acyl-CoA thioesterase n=1 Tax=Nocardioides mangrovicus TaxID=2478913 RepID=UPI001314A732|nr:acyl-CoA thioesterase domain-containing protein [Nocardioides mangrovicus]
MGAPERLRLYGGEVAAQAVMAAAATVPPDRRMHSLHAHYLDAGDSRLPVLYRVRVARDGRSFSSRSVEAFQDGRQIFALSASFQCEQDGLSHQLPADCPGVDLPGPEDCGTGNEPLRAWADGVMTRLPVELRFVDDGPLLDSSLGVAPRIRAYFRVRGSLPDDLPVHEAGLTYLSDLLMISAALVPHKLSIHDPRLFTATITHSVWLHAPLRADAWQLYDVEGSWAGGGRTLSRGRVYDADGFLCATTSQEGLARYSPHEAA